MKSWFGRIGLMIALALAPALAAAQSAAAPGAPPVPTTAEGYVLGVGDVVEVAVLDSADYKARVAVEADGTIVLPLIGRVSGGNMPVLKFRDLVRDRLIQGGFFVRPEVSVIVVTASSRFVTVLGEIGSPGVVALDRQYHLSEIIARVGGIKGAGIDTVTLTTAAGQSQEYSLASMATGLLDPVVSAGDKIFVAPAKTFYIYGQVASPGTYPIDPGLTIRRALARGGGLTALGSERKVKLIRGEREMNRVKLEEKVLPGDTIIVGERFF